MTIVELLKQVGITEFNKPIKWRDDCPCNEQGIYIISFCKDPHLEMRPTEPQFDDNAIQMWIDFLPEFKLNMRRPNVYEVKQELKRFWLPEENILYIGNTTKVKRTLHQRIDEEYKTTQLGKRGPHSGGQWLKTLKNIDTFYIHYIPTESTDIKPILLEHFRNTIGKLPFANLTIQAPKPKNINFYKKKHNFSKQGHVDIWGDKL